MTRMYPTIADPHAKSPAERRLYETFARELGVDWVVFYHVKCIGKDDLGRPRDGETDFVVAHPHLGVLVIEVKGDASGLMTQPGITPAPTATAWTTTSTTRSSRPPRASTPSSPRCA